MKTIDKPTFKSDSGQIFTRAIDAASEDVRSWLDEMFRGNSDTFQTTHIRELANHWLTIREKFNIIYEDLRRAQAIEAPPFGARMPDGPPHGHYTESQTLELDDAEREALEGVR